ncbi:hypothetical protein COJ39_23625 [Bacillus cereus]|nr:hypothetical protein CN482_13740 [Bacillus cereus]PEX29040.1 hypothetical protein CN459_22285 [Bacillus cereus]PEY15212.1 hypothetical protein CN342_23310 [Bacillus cereus]PFM05152.1 hypothetical protein COJ39_23625 [Bacillus cereus]
MNSFPPYNRFNQQRCTTHPQCFGLGRRRLHWNGGGAKNRKVQQSNPHEVLAPFCGTASIRSVLIPCRHVLRQYHCLAGARRRSSSCGDLPSKLSHKIILQNRSYLERFFSLGTDSEFFLQVKIFFGIAFTKSERILIPTVISVGIGSEGKALLKLVIESVGAGPMATDSILIGLDGAKK